MMDCFESFGVTCEVLGTTTHEARFVLKDGGDTILNKEVAALRDTWEATSFELERLQANPKCVTEEQAGLAGRKGMNFEVNFSVEETNPALLTATEKPRVAVVRQEGSNGDREMVAAFHLAGFSVTDVVMSDLADQRISLDDFRGAAFVGGFSYADVLDSAKGWAGTIRHREQLRDQFTKFFERDDTFSLGVCNGCQLLALLGVVPFAQDELSGVEQPRFVHNER
mmetsp:Transcript_33435/g.131881  ORF Transcript_33435/g.131881 Transcript_33435/m.131881 type:complete len:225 (-) Transcript_33435:1531-2205(-)